MAQHFDAVVVGAGIGGLCAAARLAHAGYHTLLVEALDRLGGRASTEEIDGFRINTGAIALEYGGVFEETFRTVGAPLTLRIPEPAVSFRLNGKQVDISRGGWGLLLGGLTRHAAGLLQKLHAVREGELPDQALSTRAWLDGVTQNETIHALFRNLCAAIFAVNPDELPARVFLHYFMRKGAFKKFGFAPTGSIGVCRELARVVERHGEVWLSSRAEQIVVAQGRAVGVRLRRDGEVVWVDCDTVVSNIGPRHTVEITGDAHFDAEYRRQVREVVRPTANIAIHFASQTPLVDAPGLITFGKTQRLCNMGNLTATCPELAPPGWHLYVAYAVPVPAIGAFDAAKQTELALDDLRRELPGFDAARLLAIRVMRDDWPAQRSCAGFDLPRDTPVPNLWCVGDAVKPYGNAGTQACAESAKLVVEAIRGQGRAA